MNTKLTQPQIGQRIAQLRIAKDLSQEDLAKRIGISRPSLTQIELGKRNLDTLELFSLSRALQFSLDEFVSDDFKVEAVPQSEKTKIKDKTELRISVPEMDIPKFKNVLLYILEQCAGKPNIGETVLDKLLYFCDFNYYELYEEHLTGARYKKLPFGPVPQKLGAIINQMIDQNQLKRVKTEYHGLPQTRYLPLEKADLMQLSAAEKTVIDDVVRQMGDWNANKISDYSHQDKPWKATKDGDYISYNLVFYRRPPFSVREYLEEAQDDF
jgi:transcriptional regulator with XRE-family HTH domain